MVIFDRNLHYWLGSKDTVQLKLFLFHINLLDFIHTLHKFPKKILVVNIFI